MAKVRISRGKQRISLPTRPSTTMKTQGKIIVRREKQGNPINKPMRKEANTKDQTLNTPSKNHTQNHGKHASLMDKTMKTRQQHRTKNENIKQQT